MEKIWLQRYPPGVPAEIDPDRFGSLVEMFEEAVARYREQTAFINMGKPLTYGELDADSLAFAAFLQQQLGLQSGERLALMMPNLLQYPIAMFGALRAGLVVVNVNPLYTPRELEHQLCDSGATAIVVASNFAHTLEQVVERTAIRHVVLTHMGDRLGLARGALVNFVVRYVKRLIPKYRLPGACSLRQALEQGRGMTLRRPPIDREDLAFLQYTGGTTGVAKGAMLSHRNLLANVAQCLGVYGPVLRPGAEWVVTALPLYHIFALTVNCLLFLQLGARNLLITNPRDIPGLIREVTQHPITCITGVNTLFNALLNHADFAEARFPELRLVIGGGMPIQRAVAERWLQQTGTHLLEGYGLTETSPLVSVCPFDEQGHSGSIGLPVCSTDVRIMDESGQELTGLDMPGELEVRGPQVMSGYWQRPEGTAEVLHEGWLKTGDVAVWMEQGYLRIVDRKKDMILVSGFNVYPNEIEEVVAMHPQVKEVAAIGLPDAGGGELVKIVVVRRDRSLDADTLRAHCRKHLTAYKVPKMIEFRTELPKSNVGKILRRVLRDEDIGTADT